MKPPNTPEMSIYIASEELLRAFKQHTDICNIEGHALSDPALIRVTGHMGVPDYEKFKASLT